MKTERIEDGCWMPHIEGSGSSWVDWSYTNYIYGPEEHASLHKLCKTAIPLIQAKYNRVKEKYDNAAIAAEQEYNEELIAYKNKSLWERFFKSPPIISSTPHKIKNQLNKISKSLSKALYLEELLNDYRNNINLFRFEDKDNETILKLLAYKRGNK